MSININRLMNDINELGKIGYVDGIGTTRQAYSKSFYEGRKFVEELMKNAGLKTNIDKIGNLTGYLEGRCNEKIIAMGSHIDTVLGGGIFDGALGVLAAIEVVRALKKAGYKNSHPIEIIAFNEEEGNVIGGTFGSNAFIGSSFDSVMLSKMTAQGLTKEDFFDSKRSSDNYRCYLELHVEQGGCLENQGVDIGVVSGIVGIIRYKATVIGKSNHSGSTPMNLRDDALEKTCRIISEMMEAVRTFSDTMVCTVGTLKVMPGEVNVIPGTTEFIIEMRDVNLDNVLIIIDKIQTKWCERGFFVEEYIKQGETFCDEKLMKIIENSTRKIGYSFKHIISGAGHDLMNMAKFTPSSLIFIPSHMGISHNIMEFSKKEDIFKGARVLYETLIQIDKEGRINEN